jgi:hypothetical protein
MTTIAHPSALAEEQQVIRPSDQPKAIKAFLQAIRHKKPSI